jgi:hypothetical protein
LANDDTTNNDNLNDNLNHNNGTATNKTNSGACGFRDASGDGSNITCSGCSCGSSGSVAEPAYQYQGHAYTACFDAADQG